MKKEILRITIAFLILTGKLAGQSLDGIWFSSYTLETTKRHIPYTPDSVYNRAYLLIDFIDKENLIFKPFGGNQEIGKFSIDNDNLRIDIGNNFIMGKFSENELILTIRDTVDYVNKIFFKRINPSVLEKAEMPDNSRFFNSSWEILSEPISENYGMKLYFLEKDSLDYFHKNIVMITKNKGSNGYTGSGNYKIDFYKNHFFIGIFNKQSLEENVYHFYKFVNNIFYADTYENSHSFEKPPRLNKIKFFEQNHLTSQQKSGLESKLKGKWRAINNPIPFDSICSDYKEFENQSFVLVFKKNNEFELIKKGILINGNIRLPKSVIINGKWKISETGNYIQIKPDDSWLKYFTIKELSKGNLIIFDDVSPLEEKCHYYSKRTLIELIK